MTNATDLDLPTYDPLTVNRAPRYSRHTCAPFCRWPSIVLHDDRGPTIYGYEASEWWATFHERAKKLLASRLGHNRWFVFEGPTLRAAQATEWAATEFLAAGRVLVAVDRLRLTCFCVVPGRREGVARCTKCSGTVDPFGSSVYAL